MLFMYNLDSSPTHRTFFQWSLRFVGFAVAFPANGVFTFENIHEGWLKTRLANRTFQNLFLATGTTYSIFIITSTCFTGTCTIRVYTFCSFFIPC